MRKDVRRHTLAPADELVRPIPVADFKGEVEAWASRLDVTPKEVRLTGLRSKWASCSPRGRVTFDVGLLRQPEPFRREVIVHELLHLKIPNHGPLFRARLLSYLAADGCEVPS
jgi:predicted metal-dependent hydrolase